MIFSYKQFLQDLIQDSSQKNLLRCLGRLESLPHKSVLKWSCLISAPILHNAADAKPFWSLRRISRIYIHGSAGRSATIPALQFRKPIMEQVSRLRYDASGTLVLLFSSVFSIIKIRTHPRDLRLKILWLIGIRPPKGGTTNLFAFSALFRPKRSVP